MSAAVVRRMNAFLNLLRSADGAPVLDYEDTKKPVAADLRLENDRLVLRRQKRDGLLRLRRKRQPVEREIPLNQVAFACPSQMVEDKDCFWIVGASHTPGKRIINCEKWRLKLLIDNPPPIQNVLDFLQSQGNFDNIVLTNFVPTEVANLISEAVSAANDIASVAKDIVGLSVVTPLLKLTFMCVATIETVESLKSDFITFVAHWNRVRKNLEKSKLLGRAINKLAEDFFFKSALGKMGASKDFVANLKRLNDRAGMAVDARLLELASDQNKALEELQAGVDEILRILCLARDAMSSWRSLGILAAVAVAIVLNFVVPGISQQAGADTLQLGIERVQTGVEQLQAGFEELLQFSRASVVALPTLILLVISSASILYTKIDSIKRQTTSDVLRHSALNDDEKKFDWMSVKSMLPQSRLFMGREDELREIREYIQKPRSITALVGVAGCGKSHLAREAADEWSRDGPEKAHRIVLFASVANEESYVSSLLRIMKTLGLEPVLREGGKPVPTAELSRRIHDRLAEAPSNVEVLWILDNAPVSANGPRQLSVWFGPDEARSWSNLRVLLTSQSKEYAFTTSLGEVEMVSVNPLPTDVSLELLTKTFPNVRNNEDELSAATELVSEFLHNLPVAILPVASLIFKRSWTIRRYLKRHQEKKVTAGVDSVREVLQDALAEARRDPSLARVLDVAAFVRPDSIPLSLLGNDEELVEQLCVLNLLQVVMDEHYSMHGLIQAAARIDRSPRDAIVALDDAVQSFDHKSHDTWPAAVALLPHFEALHRVASVETVLVELSIDDLKVYGWLLYSCGLVYHAVLCKLEQSRILYEESLRLQRTVHGVTANHEDIAGTLSNLGSVYQQLGQFGQAKGYYGQALVMYRVVYGGTTDHADVAMTLCNLGEVYRHLGEYDRAMDYYEQALAMFRAVYGATASHTSIANTLNNLGLVYLHLGENERAKDYFEQALAMRRAVYGVTANHADIALTLNNLGNVYSNLWDYEQAKDYYEQALAMRRAVYGVTTNHAEIATSLNALGIVFYDLGEYQQAKNYLDQALVMYRSVYEVTANHAYIASTLNNLGNVYYSLGQFEKARDYFEQALAMLRGVYGATANHAEIAMTLNNLGVVYEDLGEYDKAKDYYEQALTMQRAVYGFTANHADIVKTLKNLGLVYSNLGQYDPAKDYYEQALTMQRAIYGVTSNHPDIASTLNSLGNVYQSLGEYEQAMDYFEQALAMYRAVYGVMSNHAEIANTLNNLGIVYKDLGQYEQAKDYYEQALAMYRVVYGETTNHADIATSLHNLGNVYKDLGQYEQAKDYYEQTLSMERAVYGATANHADVAMTLNTLGNVCRELGEYMQAKDYYGQALSMRRAVYGITANHADIADTLLALARVYFFLGDWDKAKDHFVQALKMFRIVHQGDESHPDIQRCLRIVQDLSQIGFAVAVALSRCSTT